MIVLLDRWTLMGVLHRGRCPKVVKAATSGAFDGQADVLAFAQFAVAFAAADIVWFFSHCKPFSTVKNLLGWLRSVQGGRA
jgi:hypothetical protein